MLMKDFPMFNAMLALAAYLLYLIFVIHFPSPFLFFREILRSAAQICESMPEAGRTNAFSASLS